jgi:hypothetical protein
LPERYEPQNNGTSNLEIEPGHVHLDHSSPLLNKPERNITDPASDISCIAINPQIMATMFESSLSTSTMRPPFPSADAPSMADTLPSINFGFEELRERMTKFTVKFDDFIEKGRKRVLEERNQFRINVAELHGRFDPAFLSPYVLIKHAQRTSV